MNKSKRRLIVLVTVPLQQQIPEYVYCLARGIRRLDGDFYIVVNGSVKEDGRVGLESVCDRVVLRKNEDYDIGAYREIVMNRAAEGRLDDYGELVLLNDSFYGPIYPFTDVFEEMEKKAVDFWGLTAHPRTEAREQYFIEEHLQSYFLVVREHLLHSVDFRNFWMELPSKIPSRELAIESFEKRFTRYFSESGYSWASYIDRSIFSVPEIHRNYNPYAYSSLEMIEKYHLPVLKRSIIPLKSMEYFANWDDAGKCLQFIDKETDYNVDLIWDDLLLRFDVNMLKKYLHMTYVIAADRKAEEGGRLLFVLYGGYGRERIPDWLNQHGDIVSWNGRETSISSEDLLRYDYLCFLNFKAIDKDARHCEKRTIFKNLMENLVKDERYVSSVIRVFEENRRLGILFSADPYFSEIFDGRKKAWKNRKCGEMKQLAGERRYQCIVSEEWMPETCIGSFWCRTDLFAREEGAVLFSEILNGDAEKINCLPYLCQHYGYLTGEVLSAECASERLCNYQYALSAITDASYIYGINEGNLNNYHIRFCQQVMRHEVINFCAEYPKVYIYGAGAYGAIFANLLNREHITYEGFLVSRGQYKGESMLGKPIWYLDEIDANVDSVGILVAVPPQVQSVIQKICSKQGYHNLYCFKARIANK